MLTQVSRLTGRAWASDQTHTVYFEPLATYKQPRRVIILDALPRTSVGKIEKKALRALAARF